MATDRDIIFVIIVLFSVRAHFDTSSRSGGTATTLKRKSETVKLGVLSLHLNQIFPCMRIIKRDTFVCFESFVCCRCSRYYQQGITMKIWKIGKKLFSCIQILFRKMPIEEDKISYSLTIFYILLNILNSIEYDFLIK